MRINLGSGPRKMPPPWVNIDCAAQCEPDIVHDLECGLPASIGDGTVTEVRAIHVLEHIHDLCGLMQGLYHAMKPGALLHITVPHPFSDGWMGDPTHCTPITINTLNLFSKAKCAEFKANNWPNTPLADYLDVDFTVVDTSFTLMPQWKDDWVRAAALEFSVIHNVNVVDEVSFVLRRV